MWYRLYKKNTPLHGSGVLKQERIDAMKVYQFYY